MTLTAYLKKLAIPHKVPRSAWVFCPDRSSSEGQHLRYTDPQGGAWAIGVDEVLRRPRTVAN
ncbi:MAG: hypothetical protein JO252_17750, partial [Planctomycetaceae bacterium]|nr:hypothetical protein [Planctomycetaceae bacterium]